jgi:DNA-binding NarL/FixJ family response regulator
MLGFHRADAQALRNTLLFVTPPETVPECLLHAVEKEFPELATRRVADLEAACEDFQHPVSLMLLDAALLKGALAGTAAIFEKHPASATAVVYDGEWHRLSYETMGEVLGSKRIRGILPMNLKLDLWLSVLRIMLRGGEYFPAGLFATRLLNQRAMDSNSPVQPADNARRDGSSECVSPNHLDDLTERECQILGMVSRGHQNKLIAAELKLSEHTVKVHLHHIIKKLGVHNRTGAAAIFLKHIDPQAASAEDRVLFKNGGTKRALAR